MRRRLLITGGLLLAGLVAWVLCRGRETGRPESQGDRHSSPSDLHDFTGSEACRVCHAEIARAFAAHPMAHSLEPVRDQPPASAAPQVTTFSAGPWTYRVEHAGGTVVHREQLLDAGGRALTDQETVVKYSIGSGIRGQSYLIDRGGLFFQSPISWYAQARKWDLSPGFSSGQTIRFERRVGDDCLSCHAGRTHAVGRERADCYLTPPFYEAAIGCERCHGPGRRHVERMRKADVAAAGGDLEIVNPARLARRERDSVCYQCHLSANRVPRYGRRHDDFRPGMVLEEIWGVLIHADDNSANTAPDRAVSHVQQMCASRCFQQSSRSLTCTSCHDPHRLPPRETAADYYRERCLKCHGERGCALSQSDDRRVSVGDSCIDCHMPRRNATDMAHTTQTDHRIAREGISGGRSNSHKRSGKLVFFDGSDERMPVWEARRILGLALFKEAYRDQDQALLEAAGHTLQEADRLHPDDPEVLQALAIIEHRAGHEQKSRALLEQALSGDPQNENALKLLGIACLLIGDYDASGRHFRQLLALNPWNAEAEADCTRIQAAFSDLPGAIRSAERGLQLAPAMTRLRKDLVKLYEAAGDHQRSREQRALLERIEALLEK